MCTTAAKSLDNGWFLLKTRDPVEWMRWDDEIKLFETPQDKYKKLIIQNPNPNEDGYYGGINDRGVAIVSTFVKVAEDQVSYIRRPYVRLILDARTAKEAVEIIKNFSPRIGGNMFIADSKKCFGLEGVPEKYLIEEVTQESVKTNHFINLPNQSLSFKEDENFEQWTKDRYLRASKLLKEAKSLFDFQNILRDRENSDKNTAICTTANEDSCFTHSAFIFDTKNIKAYYCQGNPLDNDFIEYGF